MNSVNEQKCGAIAALGEGDASSPPVESAFLSADEIVELVDALAGERIICRGGADQGAAGEEHLSPTAIVLIHQRNNVVRYARALPAPSATPGLPATSRSSRSSTTFGAAAGTSTAFRGRRSSRRRPGSSRRCALLRGAFPRRSLARGGFLTGCLSSTGLLRGGFSGSRFLRCCFPRCCFLRRCLLCGCLLPSSRLCSRGRRFPRSCTSFALRSTCRGTSACAARR